MTERIARSLRLDGRVNSQISRAGGGRDSLRDLVVGAKHDARARKLARQPGAFWQVGVGLVETDEHRLQAAFDALAQIRHAIETEPHPAQRPGQHIAPRGRHLALDPELE